MSDHALAIAPAGTSPEEIRSVSGGSPFCSEIALIRLRSSSFNSPDEIKAFVRESQVVGDRLLMSVTMFYSLIQIM